MIYRFIKKIMKIKKIIAFLIVFTFITSPFFPIISGDYEKKNDYKESFPKGINGESKSLKKFDVDFVHSIVENLSYIIFTEYNESAGELAKGRGFGTKGEHKAAEILFENMTKIGLNAKKEKLNNTDRYPNLIKGYNVLDYKLEIKNETKKENIQCYINAVKLKNPKHERIVNKSFKDIKIKLMPNTTKGWFSAFFNDRKQGKYVFLSDIRNILSRNPNASLSLEARIIRKIFYPIQNPVVFYHSFKRSSKRFLIDVFFKNCVGIMIYDFTNDTHNTGFNTYGEVLPIILINGTDGRKILNNHENFTIDFFIKEMYNRSIESYNVIGLLEGECKNKTVIVDCLYDSVWSQGTGDAAIGMGIVMGVAKYFKDNNIYPKCNIKFIGFGGEEAGLLGAKYYEDIHEDESVTHVIDLNQVCSLQKCPRLTLNVIFNKLSFMNEIWPIIKDCNYSQRVGIKDIAKRWWLSGAPSDDRVFNMFRWPEVKTVSFLEDFPWIAHHRDGRNHTEGDVFKHVNWGEVEILGEMIVKIVRYITVENYQLKSF